MSDYTMTSSTSWRCPNCMAIVPSGQSHACTTAYPPFEPAAHALAIQAEADRLRAEAETLQAECRRLAGELAQARADRDAAKVLELQADVERRQVERELAETTTALNLRRAYSELVEHKLDVAKAERDDARKQVNDMVLALMKVGGSLMLKRYVDPVQWAGRVVDEYNAATPRATAAEAEAARLRAACQGLVDYARRNRHNWQTEKVMDYIRQIDAALTVETSNGQKDIR